MRFASRALIAAALTIFVLCQLGVAQTLRNENDPRNISPTVGTGGPPGGPTGLFTIYDGQTLRKGEFTFSVAYSNFDRDPGNVDITEVPVSFQVGINDHLELFFNTDAYKGVKVNSPQNLSSFYLPNSQLNFGGGRLGSGAAIILAPQGPNVGTLRGTAVFRPPFCPACAAAGTPNATYFQSGQPFVGYPYVGFAGPNFGQGPGFRGSLFGFPGFATVLGPPIAVGNSGRFGPADAFPGIGSTVGSILPGVVLATAALPPTILSPGVIVPTTFTIAPSYLPDEPFINRLYGESSFSTFVVGAKYAFTGPKRPLSFGIMPFYRFYADNGDSSHGFNQMQRGASPGSRLGDFGLGVFMSGRLSRSVNVSVNGTYIVNSNPRGSFPTGEFTLLDRPDELQTGIGFDFPVNKHFQPVAELRSTRYVGGRTPNAFENSPVEGLLGAKIYATRYMGFGIAYRRHLNQQNRSRFNGVDFNTSIQQTTNVFVPGRGIVVIPGTTRPATAGGFPIGFVESDDPNGYIGQFWVGRRNGRAPEFLPNQPPTVTLSAANSTITLPCPEGTTSTSCTPSSSQTVALTANANDPDGDTLLYTYNTTGGRITGEGPNVSWDLTGVQPGTYTATVEVDDGCGCVSFSSTTATVAACTGCEARATCPTVNVSCPDTVDVGAPITFTANVSGGSPNLTPTYNWSVSAGTISSGQGTSSITVDTTGTGGQTITATVELGGVEPSCNRTASCSTTIKVPVGCKKFDEYNDLRFNDEKARLDNAAIQLQQEPGSTLYYVIFGGCEGEGGRRSERAKDYLDNTRGIDAGRVIVVDGGCRETLTVELHICPVGAAAPTPSNTATVTPCPSCKPVHHGRHHRPTRRRHRGGSEDEE